MNNALLLLLFGGGGGGGGVVCLGLLLLLFFLFWGVFVCFLFVCWFWGFFWGEGGDSVKEDYVSDNTWQHSFQDGEGCEQLVCLMAEVVHRSR